MSTRMRLLMLAALLLLCAATSLMAGAHWLSPVDIWHAVWMPSATNVEDLLIRTTRISRTVLAITVGASLAVAGGILQTLTHNPLASPGILGINAGALFVVVLIATFGGFGISWSPYAGAFLGAAVAAAIVWWLAMHRATSASPLRLILAGAALAALFSAFTQALLVIDQQGLDAALFWLAGSVSGRPLDTAWPLVVIAAIGLLLSAPLLRDLNVLSAGDTVAASVGVRLRRLQALAIGAIVLLAGASVALAGNIVFIGLIVPHIARRLLAADLRVWLPGAALLGAILTLGADIAARLLIQPGEIPIGVMTALIGAPLFIILVRRQRNAHV
ncbi:transport system permease protein [Salinisphaera dokdonensis CL-ES53]|uniref:Transport system permease protein n=1 Tax=Salinisphaera dokdonensis CL-ES53 TaxID=1304272 RepID=A0ABV2B294_9GAMM